MDILDKIHDRQRCLRRFETIVTSPTFERLWAASNEVQKLQFYDALDSFSDSKAREWMKNHPDIELEEMSSAQLKELARFLKITNYSRMTKPELILEIRNDRDAGTI